MLRACPQVRWRCASIVSNRCLPHLLQPRNLLMNGPDTIKQAWRAIGGDPALPDLDAARAGADRFYRAVRRRNTIEYAACAVVVICFSAIAASFPLFIVRIGAVMV